MEISFDSIQPVEFVWHKAEDGYYWKEDGLICSGRSIEITAGPFIDRIPPGRQTRPEEIVIRKWPTEREPYVDTPLSSFEYRPLENYPTLFFQFAATDPSRDGILAFANEYGQLTDPFPEEYSVLENGEETFGECAKLKFWQQEIREMSRLVRLHELWKDKDRKTLRKAVTWNGNNATIGTTHVIRVPKRDVLLVAQRVIQARVNDRFDQGLDGSRSYVGIRPALKLNGANQLVSYLMPDNLLSAMWIQLYQEVIGKTNFKRCEICHEPVDVTDKSSNWHFHPWCYNAQKQKEYRARKRAEQNGNTTRGG